ncbi:MAG: sigma-54 dependent transcriptional regulator, partial [Elusimicrobiota bacterium]
MEEKISIFLLNEEKGCNESMIVALSRERYNLEVFYSTKEALEATTERKFDVGLIDINAPDTNSIGILGELKRNSPPTELVVLSGELDTSLKAEVMKLGCHAFLIKPVKLDELGIIINRIHSNKTVNKDEAVLKEELCFPDMYYGMVGKSQQMKRVFFLIEKVAKTSSLVLVTGESGTGKELVARAIHSCSNRHDKPFIIIDCASLSESLLENELFGHEKGAYTDATFPKRGLFEVADGGTLFIDEIGEMKLSTQSKLLRVIETHQFRRLGGTKQTEIDVRIVAATNRNLREEIKKGNFREDLYYRLDVVNIH